MAFDSFELVFFCHLEVEYTDMLDQKYATGNGNLGDGDGDNVKKEEVSDAVRTIKNEYVRSVELYF